MKKPTAAAERAALIDELGAIDVQIAPLEDLAKRAAEIRAKVRAGYAAQPGDKAFTAEGEKFLCTVGMAGNERSISSMTAVQAAVGESLFLGNCGFTLTKLDALLAPSTVALLTTSARTGPRQVKTFARAKAKAAA